MSAGAALITPGIAGYERSRALRRRGVLILALFAILWAVVAASGLPPAFAPGMRVAGIVVSAAVVLATFRPGNQKPERRRRQPAGWYRKVGLALQA